MDGELHKSLRVDCGPEFEEQEPQMRYGVRVPIVPEIVDINTTDMDLIIFSSLRRYKQQAQDLSDYFCRANCMLCAMIVSIVIFVVGMVAFLLIKFVR